MQSSTTLREVVHMINEQSLVPYLSVIGSKNLTWFTRLFLTRRAHGLGTRLGQQWVDHFLFFFTNWLRNIDVFSTGKGFITDTVGNFLSG